MSMKQEKKMTIKIKGDLILTKDTTYEESIEVEGDIKGWFNLKVIGNIDAKNIDALNIYAENIDALNIYAMDIICETRVKKSETSKTRARIYIKSKSQIELKEH